MRFPFVIAAFAVAVGCAQNATQISAKTEDPAPEPSTGLTLGAPAADFEVTSLGTGRPVRLSSLKGKVVLVDFWATWCKPCRMEFPHEEALYKELKKDGLEIMAISSEDPGKIASFAKEAALTLPLYRDEGAEAQQQYHGNLLPTTLVIDRQGNLSSYFVGYHDASEIRVALRQAGLP